MKVCARLVSSVGLAALLGVALSLLCLGGDGVDGKDVARWYLGELRRSEALEQRSSEVSQMMETKSAVIDDLLAQRVSLREAAEQFTATTEIIEDGNNELISPYRVPKTEAGVCRQVMAWVKAELSQRGDPEQAEKVTRRLESEFVEQFSEGEPMDAEAISE